MTDAWTERDIGLLPGLPRLLWRNPERLVEMLGLNRKARRRLAAMAPAWRRSRVRRDLKEERGRVSRRDVELTLIALRYSDPIWRHVAWEQALAGQVARFPSLLFEILRDFVEAVRRDPADSGSEENRIAEQAWAAAQRDLGSWDQLDSAARERCVLVTFAVASVLDDPYILVEAMETVRDLTQEFRLMVTEDMLPEPPAEEEWKEVCEELAGFALRAAGPPPDPAMLDSITISVGRLDFLDAEIVRTREAIAQARFSVEVELLLAQVPTSPEFAWLHETRLESVKEAWRLEAQTIYPDEAATEEARLRSALDPAVEAVRDAARACDAARARVTACREARPGSLFRRRAWRASLAEHQAREHECEKALDSSRQALLHAISPFGRWSREPSDEEREREAGAGERTGSSGGAAPDAPGSEEAREGPAA